MASCKTLNRLLTPGMPSSMLRSLSRSWCHLATWTTFFVGAIVPEDGKKTLESMKQELDQCYPRRPVSSTTYGPEHDGSSRSSRHVFW